MRTLDQQRARAAWRQTPEGEGLSDEYLSLVRGAAATMMTSGLGQTLAFYMAKATSSEERSSAHTALLRNLARWLLRDKNDPDTAPNNTKQPVDLLNAVMEGDGNRYRELTAEALAYLTWLKRFAEAKKLLADESRETSAEPTSEAGQAPSTQPAGGAA